MVINPFDWQCAEAKKRIDAASEKKRQLTRDLSWYRGLNVIDVRAKLDGAIQQSKFLGSQLAALDVERTGIKSELVATRASIGSLLNPANWFDKTQAGLRLRCRELTAAEAALNDRAHLLADESKQAYEVATKLNADLSRHAKFDVGRCESEVSEIERQFVDAERELELLSSRKREADARLAPILREIDKLESSKTESERKLRRARELDSRMTEANNSYERAMLHKDCETEFGVSSPRKVVGDQERIIRQIDRDLEKATSRGEDVAYKAGRVIDTVVVDGNNLCYAGDRFIGLAAIRSLLPLLSKDRRVIVVFDAAIRRMVRIDDSSLRRQLADAAMVHVVATRRQADETILDLASDDIQHYVLSNDRFGDFREKSVVKEERLIRHEIVDGRIFIHDLDLKTSYQ